MAERRNGSDATTDSERLTDSGARRKVIQAREEDELISNQHAEAAAAQQSLSRSTQRVCDLVAAVGRDAAKAERLVLKQLTEMSCRLYQYQFADL
jgi:hypothetical protein